MTLLLLLRNHSQGVVITDAMRLTSRLANHASDAAFTNTPEALRLSSDPRPSWR